MPKQILETIAQDLINKKLTPGGEMIAKRIKDLYATIASLDKVGEDLLRQMDDNKKELNKSKAEVAKLELDYEKLKG